jgi:hypothetical protein
LLLLDLWARGRVARSKLPVIAQATPEDWSFLAPVVLPVLLDVRPRVIESRKLLRASKEQRLPTALWNAVLEIVFAMAMSAFTAKVVSRSKAIILFP